MTRSSVLVRAPRAEDETVWRRLWAAYLEFYGAIVAPDATDMTLGRILTPGGAVFGRLADRGGAVVGFTICVVHEGTWSVKPTCYLEDLFVDPAARGAGVGRALMDDLMTIGTEGGWSTIYWHTRFDNIVARKLYDRYAIADEFVRYRLAMSR